MKKILGTLLLFFVVLAAGAQSNIQFHYDFGKHIYNNDEHTRQDATITYEGFNADKLGSWYYFIDADLDKNGLVGAYTELSREFTLFKTSDKSTFAVHGEINAGLSRDAGVFQPAFLVGAAWNWHSEDFSKTLSFQLMYKQFTGQLWTNTDNKHYYVKPYCSAQFTTVWGLNFCNDKLRFCGFIDFWLGKKASDGGSNLVILTEPQLWYNISKKCAIGTEIEMSSNFIYSSSDYMNDKFYINPTIAFKFQF